MLEAEGERKGKAKPTTKSGGKDRAQLSTPLFMQAWKYDCTQTLNWPKKNRIGEGGQRNGKENELEKRAERSVKGNQQNQDGENQQSASFPNLPKAFLLSDKRSSETLSGWS